MAPAPASGRAFRVDHGGGQSSHVPPLAELARHRGAGAGRGDRPHGRHPGRAVCGSFLALSPARSTGPPIGVDATPGLGLPARAEIPCVLDRFARRGRLKPSTVDAYLLVWPCACAGHDGGKDPCPLLHGFGQRLIGGPSASPRCILTPRRPFAWSSPGFPMPRPRAPSPSICAARLRSATTWW